MTQKKIKFDLEGWKGWKELTLNFSKRTREVKCFRT